MAIRARARARAGDGVDGDAVNGGRRGYVSGGGLVPVPDPTKLTTDQLTDKISGLHELFEAYREGDKAIVSDLKEQFKLTVSLVDEKIDGRITERVAGKIDLLGERIRSLSDVTTQQFKSITDTFAEKDKAVSVGLSAQKEAAAAQQASNTEATNKMESNFTKLLDQGQELLAEVRRNTEIQIGDIKDRLTSIESRAQGVTVQKAETSQTATQNWAYIVGILGFVIGFSGLIVAVLFHH